MRGCTPRVDGGTHRSTVIAQLEVASGKISGIGREAQPGSVVSE